MNRPITRVLAFVLLAACSSDAAVAPPDDDSPDGDRDVSWLQQQAVPLVTDQPGADAADLAVLGAAVGDARVVVFGQGTLGTAEFLKLQHRMLQYLVRELDFDALVLFAPFGEVEQLNRYLQTGEGSAAGLLAGTRYWVWNTQEVLDVVGWLRAHNVANPGRAVSVGGYSPYSVAAMAEVLAYLERVDGAAYVDAGARYACWSTWRNAATYRALGGAIGDSIRSTCRTGVEAVHVQLGARRGQYEAQTSPAEYERALRAARIVVIHEQFARGDGTVSMYEETISWYAQRDGGSRIVVWADLAAVESLGPLLRQRWGDQVVLIGSSFGTGSFNAYGGAGTAILEQLGVRVAAAPADGSYERHFTRVDLDRFLLDLRPLRGAVPESAAWLRGPLTVRMVPPIYDIDSPHLQDRPVALPTAFDLWLHVRYSTPSKLLPLGG